MLFSVITMHCWVKGRLHIKSSTGKQNCIIFLEILYWISIKAYNNRIRTASSATFYFHSDHTYGILTISFCFWCVTNGCERHTILITRLNIQSSGLTVINSVIFNNFCQFGCLWKLSGSEINYKDSLGTV